MDDVISLKNEALAQITEATSAEEIESLRIAYLGRNGKVTLLTQKLKDLPAEKRKEAGLTINEAKNTISQLLSEQKNKLQETSRVWFDPTVPGELPSMGHTHLVSQAIAEIARTFADIGFVRVRYPEVEWDYFAFTALNMPREHAARDEWETFFVDGPVSPKYGQIVLTPHTSNGQVREMLRVSKPPIRMINIAKCYRRQSDISHYPMFHQFEGLVVDKGISIAELKGTLDYFVKNFFGAERITRLRPYHFQFTEPSFEVDISCDLCGGKGCKMCKSGWLELGGAGMVHPTVLKNGGIDHNIYSGFAFGWGVERTYMMKAGVKIDDIRKLYSSDIRFLKQF
jgi:phenylalanyl-tRNA synthetase alpha chain